MEWNIYIQVFPTQEKHAYEGKTWLRKKEMAPTTVFSTNSNVCDMEAIFNYTLIILD